MPDVVVLTCPQCGGKLNITPEIERFACGFCGTEQLVKRSGGIISLAPVLKAVADVRSAVDRTEKTAQRAASELAVQRLPREIANIEHILEDQKRKRRSLSGQWIPLSGTIVFLPLLLSRNSSWVTVGLIGAGLLVLATVVSYNTQKSRLMKDEDIAALERQAWEKRSALARHRRILGD